MRSLTATGLLIALAAVTGELAARIDDRLFEGIPVLSNPTYDDLFFEIEEGVRRGRPGARWNAVRLNNLGLRGADLPIDRRPGCERWLFLGASETFGEPSIPNGNFPARIAERLPPDRCVEIANAASPAVGLRLSTAQYEHYLHRLGADLVFIYPPVHLYLDTLPLRRPVAAGYEPPPPGARAPERADSASGSPLAAVLAHSRLLARLRTSAEMPASIQRLRLRRWIDAAVAEHPPEWPYRTVPVDRIDSLERDLTDLVALVRASRAVPVLMTHAIRSSDPPRAEDVRDLFSMRLYIPRATPEVLAAFEYAAAERMRTLARSLDVALIDVAASFSGRRDVFIDLVHFTPDGNRAVADLVLNAPGVRRSARSGDAVQ